MFHPLQSDEDAPYDDLMVARARAALVWGALQGRLAHLPPDVAHHFCGALIRLAIHEAFGEAGYPGAETWFSLWFSGLEPVPGVSAHAAAPASLIAETLLGELTLSPWGPLAEAATQIRSAARFDRNDRHDRPSPPLALVVEEAAKLAQSAGSEASGPNSDGAWPLAGLDRLTQAAAASSHFAPTDREYRLLDLPAGPVALEQGGNAPPLWVLDLVAGAVIARDNPGSRPLPLPGAIRAEALKPHWWPRERAILVADTARVAARKLTVLLDAAYHAVADMEQVTIPMLTRPLALPRSEVELFFDIEVDTMRDLTYLHGIIERRGGDCSGERFHAFFADDETPDAERAAFSASYALLTADPDATIWYYSKYERTLYRKLQARYPDVCSAEDIERLFDPAQAVDLYNDVVTKATEWPTNDHSIKTLAKYLGFTWRDTRAVFDRYESDCDSL